MAAAVTVTDLVARVPDRVLRGAHRDAADALAPAARRGDAAVVELPGPGVRVEDRSLSGGGPLEALLGRVRHRITSLAASNWAVWITFCYLWLPFAILPIYAALERVPDSLWRRRATSGAHDGMTFRRVVFPLVVPGARRGVDLHVLADARRLHHADARRQGVLHRQRDLQPGRPGEQPAARGRVRDDPGRDHGHLPVARAEARRVRGALDGWSPGSRGSLIKVGTVVTLVFLYVPLVILVRSTRSTRASLAVAAGPVHDEWFTVGVARRARPGGADRNSLAGGGRRHARSRWSSGSLRGVRGAPVPVLRPRHDLVRARAADRAAGHRDGDRAVVVGRLRARVDRAALRAARRSSSATRRSASSSSSTTWSRGCGGRRRSLVEASMDLGADGWQTFRYVTLPAIRTALVAGGLLAFGLSFDEIVVTNFTGRARRSRCRCGSSTTSGGRRSSPS